MKTGRSRAARPRRAAGDARALVPLPKVPSGIHGFDDITGGGLPRGRPTLVCGGPGCGKTLFATEFLVRGATEHDEPGVFMTFEETAEELTANVASLGFDLAKLAAEKKIALEFVRLERSEIEETGDYDLEGLFVRLGLAIDSVRAKRVVLDTIESLFSGLQNEVILRSELRRLFRWLKDREVTVVITGEQGTGTLTRHGLEEYVSDCVVFLDHRVVEQSFTRRLRVVKYRGSPHGTNEYPFVIGATGISVVPITSIGLRHAAPTRTVPTGVPRLDEMLGGHGFFEGSSVLVSGTAGTGKTSFGAHLVDAACRRRDRCLFFSFEESVDQIVRNMRSIGIDLEAHLRAGRLEIRAARPTALGLESHLVAMYRAVVDLDPKIVVVDPITSLLGAGSPAETLATVARLLDFLKMRGVTAMFTSLTESAHDPEQTEVGVSSLIDTWLVLQIVRSGGERNRTVAVIKSRGMPHSNQACEFRLTARGVELADTYLGSGAVVTGSERVAREAQDDAARQACAEELDRARDARERRRITLERRIAGLRAQWEASDTKAAAEMREIERRVEALDRTRASMARSRHAFSPPPPASSPTKGASR